MTPTRIYAVYDSQSPEKHVRLIKATHQARAIHHVTGARFRAEVPSQDQLVELIGAGVKVEVASE